MHKLTRTELEDIQAPEEIHKKLFNLLEDIETALDQWAYGHLEDREALKEIVKAMNGVAYDVRAGECKAYKSV